MAFSEEVHVDSTYNRPGGAKVNGYREDSAYFIESLLERYQTTFGDRWFVAAEELADTMLTHYQSPEGVQLAPCGQLPSN